jgi:hypothetical protein
MRRATFRSDAGDADVEQALLDRGRLHRGVVISFSSSTMAFGAIGQEDRCQGGDVVILTPCSCAVASSGMIGERACDSSAIAFTCLPVLSSAAAPIWPPTRSFAAGPAPRYGTCRTSVTPSLAFSSEQARCVVDPAPEEP